MFWFTWYHFSLLLLWIWFVNCLTNCRITSVAIVFAKEEDCPEIVASVSICFKSHKHWRWSMFLLRLAVLLQGAWRPFRIFNLTSLFVFRFLASVAAHGLDTSRVNNACLQNHPRETIRKFTSRVIFVTCNPVIENKTKKRFIDVDYFELAFLRTTEQFQSQTGIPMKGEPSVGKCGAVLFFTAANCGFLVLLETMANFGFGVGYFWGMQCKSKQ